MERNNLCKAINKGIPRVAQRNQYEGIVASLTRLRPPIKLLFSNNKDETAHFLCELALWEAKDNAQIYLPLEAADKKTHIFQFLMSIPHISYITASNIVHYGKFRNLKEFVNW
jgi:ERCC4-type nuclease